MGLDWIGWGLEDVGLFAACSDRVENHSRVDGKSLMVLRSDRSWYLANNLVELCKGELT